MMSWMRGDMARRMDAVFPDAGGLEHLAQVRRAFLEKISDLKARAGETSLLPQEAEHIRKILLLLGDDKEAKATLMSWIAFGQMKNDVASI
jgi:hypothetical protein